MTRSPPDHPSLRDIQRDFAAGVFEEASTALSHLRDGTFSAERHLQVYRNNTFANLTDALAAVYSVVQRLVGEDFFRFCADRFIRRHPPHSGNLHDFGSEFAAFLGEFDAARALAYLPDVARLEWGWHEAFHAADVQKFDLARLATVAPEHYDSLCFELHPSVRLLASPFPIVRIWQVNQPDYDEDQNVDLDQGMDRVLVVRRDLRVDIELLGPGEYVLLGAFAMAKALGAAQRDATDAEPDFDLATSLRRLVQSGVIVNARLK